MIIAPYAAAVAAGAVPAAAFSNVARSLRSAAGGWANINFKRLSAVAGSSAGIFDSVSSSTCDGLALSMPASAVSASSRIACGSPFRVRSAT